MKTAASTTLFQTNTGKTGPSIPSNAHEWQQMLPLTDQMLRCSRCGATTKIGHWDVPRCITHQEFAWAGFKDESK